MATKKATKRFKRYDEGGDVEESSAKQRGLDISNKEEPVGFFERIRMGNIDDPNSEAYKRFGAGRGRAAAPDAPAAPAAPASEPVRRSVVLSESEQLKPETLVAGLVGEWLNSTAGKVALVVIGAVIGYLLGRGR
jgi:hypothetical protein